MFGSGVFEIFVPNWKATSSTSNIPSHIYAQIAGVSLTLSSSRMKELALSVAQSLRQLPQIIKDSAIESATNPAVSHRPQPVHSKRPCGQRGRRRRRLHLILPAFIAPGLCGGVSLPAHRHQNRRRRQSHHQRQTGFPGATTLAAIADAPASAAVSRQRSLSLSPASSVLPRPATAHALFRG